ncbi:hypothetical protein DFH08DRAFT_725632, partial [Mycena albidolilacea]
CHGAPITFPPGENQYFSYPFGLHAKLLLAWNFFSERDCFFVRSKNCRQSVIGSEPRLCKPCRELDERDDNLFEIRQRIANGIQENTPLVFFPVGGLIQKIRKKKEQ